MNFTRNSIAYKQDGTQVAANQPRFEQGRFGKAIMVEEGTTNLISNPSFENDFTSWGNWGTPPTREIVTSPVWHDSKALHLITNANNQGVYQILSLTAGITYTVSCWVYVVTGNPVLMVERVNDGQVSYPVVIADSSWAGDGKWHRLQLTFTAGNTSNRIHLGKSASGNIGEYYFDAIQLEQKPYATSFIDGTRADETLTIPTTGVFPDINNFTIELWAKAQTIKTDTYQGIFGGRGILGAPPVDLLIATNNQLYLFYYNSTGANTPLATGYYISDRTNWHYYAVTFCNGTVRIYVDGIKVKEANITLAQTTGNGNFYIGRSIVATQYWNGLIDDLRISNRAKSDEEILAAYMEVA